MILTSWRHQHLLDMYLPAKFGGHRSYGNGDINSYIITWTPWKKLNSLPQSAILRDFKNQEYRFTILKSRTRLAEKDDEEGEEHRKLQSVLHFKQTQKPPPQLKLTRKMPSSKREKLTNENQTLVRLYQTH